MLLIRFNPPGLNTCVEIITKTYHGQHHAISKRASINAELDESHPNYSTQRTNQPTHYHIDLLRFQCTYWCGTHIYHHHHRMPSFINHINYCLFHRVYQPTPLLLLLCLVMSSCHRLILMPRSQLRHINVHYWYPKLDRLKAFYTLHHQPQTDLAALKATISKSRVFCKV